VFQAPHEPHGEPPADIEEGRSMDFDQLLADLENAVHNAEPEWEKLAHDFIVEMLDESAGLNAFPLPFRLSFTVMFSFLVRSVNEYHTFGIEDATKHIKTAFLALYFANHIMKKELLPRAQS